MNNNRMCVAALTVALLLGSSTAFAEPTHPNEIGLYTSSDGAGATGTFVVGQPVTLYLVLTRPTDFVNGDSPCTTYGGFELRMEFVPPPLGGLFLLNTFLPGEHIDIGFKDFEHGILGFACGVSTGSPLPVVDEAIAVAELTFLNFGTGMTEVFLRPHAPGQSIPGEMAFLGGHAPSIAMTLLPMYPISGSHDAAVFRFNGAAVAVDCESFGSVKALYR